MLMLKICFKLGEKYINMDLDLQEKLLLFYFMNPIRNIFPSVYLERTCRNLSSRCLTNCTGCPKACMCLDIKNLGSKKMFCNCLGKPQKIDLFFRGPVTKRGSG